MRPALPLEPAVLLARGAARLSRLTGGGGTSLPGKLLLMLVPDGVRRLAAQLPRGSVVISATNGKTTTAAMAARILARAGIETVHNRGGANMQGGIAAALLSGSGELGLFEVDEFWLEQSAAALAPRVVVLANLFRDQLDRYGELETIGERWAAAVAAHPDATLVLGADDPLVASLGVDRPGTIYFGVEDAALARSGGLAHASDSTRCRRCGAAYRYERVFIGHLGHYVCESCGARRPTPAVSAHSIELNGVRSSSFQLRTPGGSVRVELGLPGLYNVYNALAAAALACALDVELETVATGLREANAAFGRGERIAIGERELMILLVKNPAGADEVLRTLALEHGELHVLGVLNDQTADGRDVSWIWDADFEALAPRLARVTCAGTRAAELALRLKYAGVPAERIVLEADLPRALDGALAAADGPLYALPTYTAMLALRELLVARGVTSSSWR
jgi:UDP-N-acetylmuramyl tripeptide synthase